MSRVQHRNASLQAIVQLRRLVERRAQSATMVAEQRVIQAKHQQHAEHERLDETVSQWAALFDGGVLEPELVQSWGGAVNRQVKRLDAAGLALVDEQQQLTAAQKSQYRASAETDCAEALWRRARVRYAAWREELALAEVGDAITRQHMTLPRRES